jgi:hypothetical protein
MRLSPFPADVVILPDPLLDDILEHGELFDCNRIRIVRGVANQCHRNAATLWLKGRCSALATGYYLCFDGMWRPHSWGIAKAGAILDTHSGGQKYFGIRLEDQQALAFAESDCDYDAVQRWIKKHPKRFQAMVQAAQVLASINPW